jgi:hypothetical protein
MAHRLQPHYDHVSAVGMADLEWAIPDEPDVKFLLGSLE